MFKKLIPYFVSILFAFGLFAYGQTRLNQIKFDYEAQEKEIQRLHTEELDKISKARLQEKIELEENIKNLQVALDSNQKEYEKKLADLIDKKNKDAAAISKKAPTELAQDVSNTMGIKIYTPKK